ncbi:alpha/beta hydrolase [Jiangella ureilytica]|uniref:Alpha/beta hydrolase n=1 Tax=Jiangella ureilytica TaxID=2530374 RepID=A0A4R4S4U0_9ACTN|nr:alpha/beta hydrolase [Jiangella ureilytica]
MLTVAYGDVPDQVADVWVPELPAGDPGTSGHLRTTTGAAGRTVPLVVVVHGGFWRAEYDRTHARPQCAGLAAAGYAVAAIEYRRVGAGGGWPATFDDVALALDTVPGLVVAATTGGPVAVDLSRVVHVGHSAGAHLAVWAASRHRLPAGSRWASRTGGQARPIEGGSLTGDATLAGVVSLAGVLDLAAAAALELGDGAAPELLGGDPTTRPERYAVADPMRLVPPAVPVVLLHGTEDRQVPPGLSRRYAAAAGPRITLRELPGVEHFGLIDPASAAWPAVLDAVATLLEPRG